MNSREVKKAAIVKYTAELEGVSTESVRRVMNDKQRNEDVYYTYLFIEEEVNKAVNHVKLVRAIEKMVPFQDTVKEDRDLDAFPPQELISSSFIAETENLKTI